MNTIEEKITVGELEIVLYHNIMNPNKSKAEVIMSGKKDVFFGKIEHEVNEPMLVPNHAKKIQKRRMIP